jgi:hypothetical protein
MVMVADEAWLATALLHRDQPERHAFRVEEILERARLEAIQPPLRPGVGHHITWHAVANKAPKPARHRLLYATGRGERRLFRTGDDHHPDRTGKTVPQPADIPERYRPLLDWYRAEYDRTRTLRERAPSEAFTSSVTPPRAFEGDARKILSEHLGMPLASGYVPGIPKRFDFVSSDGSVVGDAKFLTVVGGTALPPAKFSNIAEHVWLLEKTGAATRVLVFGNDRKVPSEWLRRYGHLAADVHFYFLSPDGELEDLLEPELGGNGWSQLTSSAFTRDWSSAEDSVYDDVPAR